VASGAVSVEHQFDACIVLSLLIWARLFNIVLASCQEASRSYDSCENAKERRVAHVILHGTVKDCLCAAMLENNRRDRKDVAFSLRYLLGTHLLQWDEHLNSERRESLSDGLQCQKHSLV
jgi:hypothetical protein